MANDRIQYKILAKAITLKKEEIRLVILIKQKRSYKANNKGKKARI